MSKAIVPNARQEYIEGLRKLADFLAATPDLPVPYFAGYRVSWSAWSDVAEVARLTALIPGRKSKNDPAASSYDAEYYTLTSERKFGPFQLEITSYRTTVCEKVQTGTTTVETPAVEAAPARVDEVPVFEYVCSPLLAKAVSS